MVRLEKGVAWVCGAYLVAALLYGAAQFAGHSGLDYGEGVILALVDRAAHGLSLYQDYRTYPYVYCAYGPVYLWLAALLGPSVAMGRLISVVSGLAATGCLGWLACRRALSTWSGWLAAALFLLSPFVLLWYPTMRVDMLAYAFDLGGLVVAVRGRGVWAAPLFAAAFLTRHTLVAAPLAVAAWYLLSDRRRGVQFVLAWGGLIGLSLAVGTAATHGELWDNLGSRPVGFDSVLWFGLLGDFVRLHWPLLVAAGCGARLARDTRSLACLALMWAALSLGVALSVSGASTGATINYYIECVAALALLACQRLAPRMGAALLLVQVVLIYGCVRTVGLAQPPVNELLVQAMRGPDKGAELQDVLVQALRDCPGDVLCENPGLTVLAGKPVVINDPFILGLLERSGRWRADALAQAVRDKRFSLVVMQPSPLFPPSVVAAISDAYRIKYRVGYDVLVPK